MDDEAGDMIEVLKNQVSRVQTTVDARRARELQGVHHKDRRFMRTPPELVRSVQINLRITPRFKQRISAYAVQHNLSVTEVLVRAFDHYASLDK